MNKGVRQCPYGKEGGGGRAGASSGDVPLHIPLLLYGSNPARRPRAISRSCGGGWPEADLTPTILHIPPANARAATTETRSTSSARVLASSAQLVGSRCHAMPSRVTAKSISRDFRNSENLKICRASFMPRYLFRWSTKTVPR